MVGGFKPEKDQALITQLRKAGAIIIGTTNVPYMLMDYQTYGEIYPPASNPYDTTRTLAAALEEAPLHWLLVSFH